MKSRMYFVIPALLIISSLGIILQNINPVKIDFIHNRIKKQAKGPDLRPSEWSWIQRTYPHYQYDEDVYRNAFAQKRVMMNELNADYIRKGKTIPKWEFAGPMNIGGRVVDIEFNPLDPNIVYAGASTGGVFKSTDMGNTWFPIFDSSPNINIGDIAVDPVNPNIIFVGTGEANGGHNNFPGEGIYKSTDAGNTWTLKGLEQTVSIGRIIVDHTNPQNIYVAAVGSYFSPNPERGVYKSSDGGDTWSKSLFISDSTGAIDLVMDPNNSNFLMAAMWERVRRPLTSRLYGASSGIFISSDGGTNWQKLGQTNGLPTGTNIGRIGLAMSLSDPNIVYALYNNGNSYTGFYKTTNKGTNWVNADPSFGISEGTSNFSWYFGQTRVHPTNPNIVYALDVAFMRSTNSGTSWPIIYGTISGPQQLHVDHHALAFHPTNPNYLLSGNDGGINISTDAGVTWSDPVHLPATQFYEIGLDYLNPHRLYGGTQDNNTIRTLTGNFDDWDRILGGDGFYVTVDYTNSNIIYAEWQFGALSKSTNGGANFSWAMQGINTSEPTNWSTPVIMDPNNNNVLYYGTNRLYRTTNAAFSWSVISPNLTNSNGTLRLGTITTIAVAPSNSNNIYVGTDDANVWVSIDNGGNWTKISTPALPQRWITRVVVDPNAENILYVTYSGLKWHDPQPHVFKTTNYGNNWTDISSNLPDAPVNAFAVDNNNPQRLYLGNDIGVFYSQNGGVSWNVLGTDIPSVVINDMKIHPVTNELILGTHGRSMYKINIDSITTSIGNLGSGIPEGFSLNQNYPNPFNPSTTIKYSIPFVSQVKLKVYDLLGNEIAILIDKVLTKGEHSFKFENSNLSSGVYIYKLESKSSVGKFQLSKKMLILK
ncbi:MAG: T9SS type A sorting domain-containing protein [Ignavibacteria bacterium]|nr:T9SS type A sorting domain-containing protein [Ignavibacteria bacterium]